MIQIVRFFVLKDLLLNVYKTFLMYCFHIKNDFTQKLKPLTVTYP